MSSFILDPVYFTGIARWLHTDRESAGALSGAIRNAGYPLASMAEKLFPAAKAHTPEFVIPRILVLHNVLAYASQYHREFRWIRNPGPDETGRDLVKHIEFYLSDDLPPVKPDLRAVACLLHCWDYQCGEAIDPRCAAWGITEETHAALRQGVKNWMLRGLVGLCGTAFPEWPPKIDAVPLEPGNIARSSTSGYQRENAVLIVAQDKRGAEWRAAERFDFENHEHLKLLLDRLPFRYRDDDVWSEEQYGMFQYIVKSLVPSANVGDIHYALTLLSSRAPTATAPKLRVATRVAAALHFVVDHTRGTLRELGVPPAGLKRLVDLGLLRALPRGKSKSRVTATARGNQAIGEFCGVYRCGDGKMPISPLIEMRDGLPIYLTLP